MSTGDYQFVNYSTRNFRKDLHARLRLYAGIMQITLEEAHNRAVEAGLGQLEQKTKMSAKIPEGARYRTT